MEVDHLALLFEGQKVRCPKCSTIMGFADEFTACCPNCGTRYKPSDTRFDRGLRLTVRP